MVCLYVDCTDSRCHSFSECDKATNVCQCKPVLEIYSPVCGSDMKTYDSIYQLNHTACTEDREITKLFAGSCSRTYAKILAYFKKIDTVYVTLVDGRPIPFSLLFQGGIWGG